MSGHPGATGAVKYPGRARFSNTAKPFAAVQRRHLLSGKSRQRHPFQQDGKGGEENRRVARPAEVLLDSIQQTKPGAHDIAGGIVSACFNAASDKTVEMFTEGD